MYTCTTITYSQKIWRGIKFGGLAVRAYKRQIKVRQYFLHAYIRIAIPYRTAKFKSANIFARADSRRFAKFNSLQIFRLYSIPFFATNDTPRYNMYTYNPPTLWTSKSELNQWRGSVWGVRCGPIFNAVYMYKTRMGRGRGGGGGGEGEGGGEESGLWREKKTQGAKSSSHKYPSLQLNP